MIRGFYIDLDDDILFQNFAAMFAVMKSLRFVLPALPVAFRPIVPCISFSPCVANRIVFLVKNLVVKGFPVFANLGIPLFEKVSIIAQNSASKKKNSKIIVLENYWMQKF